MGYDQKDIVILFSTIVSKIINFILMVVFILVAGLIIYGFYIFIFQPYKPGEDPVQKWFKRNHAKNNTKAMNIIDVKLLSNNSVLEKTGLSNFLV